MANKSFVIILVLYFYATVIHQNAGIPNKCTSYYMYYIYDTLYTLPVYGKCDDTFSYSRAYDGNLGQKVFDIESHSIIINHNVQKSCLDQKANYLFIGILDYTESKSVKTKSI